MNKIYNKQVLLLTLLGIASGFSFHFFSGIYGLFNLIAAVVYVSTFIYIIYKNDSMKAVFYKSFYFNFIVCCISYSWLYTPFEFLGYSKFITLILGMGGIFFVSSVLSLFVAIPVLITFKTKKSNRQVVFATTFILMEMLKGTFFNWNPIGSIWSNSPVMMQLASLVGIYGVGFITILLFSIPILIFFKQITKKQKFLFQILIVSIFIFGYNRLSNQSHQDKNTDFMVRVIDAKIPQNFVVDRETLISLKKYKDAILTSSNEKIDLFVLPESASPLDLTYNWNLIYYNNIIPLLNSPVVLGFNRYHFNTPKEYFMYNTLGVVKNGKVDYVYDKIKLVPFGEYIPFKNLLSFTKFTDDDVDFTAGKDQKILKINKFSFYPLICFEAIFTELFIPENVDAIINISNDAWFSELGKRQHYNLVKWRAVEHGVSVIRSANMGVKNKGASLINPYGAEVAGNVIKSKFDIKDFILPARIKRPIFSYIGNLGILIFLLILLANFSSCYLHTTWFSKSQKK